MDKKKLRVLFLALWAAAMAAGTALLFVGITHESLWYDESYTAALVNHSFVNIIRITGGDSHPPLYYLMLHAFRLLFGNSVLSLRTFSVLGAVALAAWGIGPVQRAVGRKAALLYTVLTFALPITLAMAQETRMYTWAAFWVTGAVLYGYLAARDGRTRDWVLFAVCALGAAYTHYYGLLAVAVLCAILLISLLVQKKKIVPFLIAAGAMVVCYLPWLLELAGQYARVKGSYWIPPVTGQVVNNTFIYPFSGKFSTPWSPKFVQWAFYLAAALILFGIIYRAIRRDKTVKLSLLAIGVFLLTIGGGILASFVIRPVFVERYMVPVLGLFTLGLAYGIASLGKRVLPIVGCAAIIAFAVPQTLFTVEKRFDGPMTEAVSYLAPMIQPGDVFLHVDEHTFGTFCYYYPDHENYYFQREGTGGYSNYDAFTPTGKMIKSLDEIAPGHRIWFIQRYGGSDPQSLPQWLGKGLLKMQGSPKSFQIDNSWYAFQIFPMAGK